MIRGSPQLKCDCQYGQIEFVVEKHQDGIEKWQ